MNNNQRRKFIRTAAALSAVPMIGSVLSFSAKEQTSGLAHQVYFWLKDPNSREDRSKLIEGLNTLRAVKTVRSLIIGTVGSTAPRDVIDRTWNVSALSMFENAAAEAQYQVDPIHLAFVKNYGHLWSKVRIYDSEIVT